MPSTESRLATSTQTGAGANAALYWCAFALLAGVAVLGLVKPLLTLWRFIPLDPNEGWNAYFGATAIDGGQLYPHAGSLTTNNYPPLSFYIVGGVGRLMGDNIFAGRVIALLSLLFVSWSIYFWLRLTGSAKRIGLLGAASFLAYAVTYGRVYVAMNDPHWLAQAIMMSGLLVLWKGKDSTGHIIVASILMMAAGWTKHLLLPLPLTVSVFLLWRSHAAFAKWALCSIAVLAVATGLAWRLYGPAFFESLLSPRQYLEHKAILACVAALKCFAPLLGLWLIALVRGRFSERLGFICAYLLISAVIAVAAAGGAGVDVNSFFDMMIAAILGAAVGVEVMWDRPAAGEGIPAVLSRAVTGAAAARDVAGPAITTVPGIAAAPAVTAEPAVLAGGAVIATSPAVSTGPAAIAAAPGATAQTTFAASPGPATSAGQAIAMGQATATDSALATGPAAATVAPSAFRNTPSWARASRGPAAALALATCVAAYAVSLAPAQIAQIENVPALEKAALADISVINAEGRGRAACQLPGLCYWAKAPFTVDFFYLGQKLKTGTLPRSACAHAFGGGAISLVELDPVPEIRQKLLPDYCNDMINSRYRPIRESSFGPLLIPAHGVSSAGK